ncbi:hypothetical protein CALVIDRAFT_204485 [Calocera viscosa TUFC12733]|uniref:Uncharacterized protein n=1 Tax=Calocera viscosa (strain TUFC12733) TaxID=1330018 RepID=A0A167KCM6_CALVF|nr:hypothetical protein CALVIDRAFT_204485 [Calocera viscosa TUFC12733]
MHARSCFLACGFWELRVSFFQTSLTLAATLPDVFPAMLYQRVWTWWTCASCLGSHARLLSKPWAVRIVSSSAIVRRSSLNSGNLHPHACARHCLSCTTGCSCCYPDRLCSRPCAAIGPFPVYPRKSPLARFGKHNGNTDPHGYRRRVWSSGLAACARLRSCPGQDLGFADALPGVKDDGLLVRGSGCISGSFIRSTNLGLVFLGN